MWKIAGWKCERPSFLTSDSSEQVMQNSEGEVGEAFLLGGRSTLERVRGFGRDEEHRTLLQTPL